MTTWPNRQATHESVLVNEALMALAVRSADTVLDATLGGAGHFSALLALLGEGGMIVGIDADSDAVERARLAYTADRRPHRPVAHLVNDNFRNLARILERIGIGQVDAALFDLGWSGYQLASARGFSFADSAQPLLMTYGEGGETAADIVNGATERELVDLLYAYGEEHHARSIARSIVAARAKARLLTAGDLVAAVEAGVPRSYREGRTHVATKTFQALRIAVNDEFGALREGLAAVFKVLAPGGRLAITTFHSLEDRIVKNELRDWERAGRGLASRKPIKPSHREVTRNRRARSAKLRVFLAAPVLPPKSGTHVSRATPLLFHV